MSWYNPRTWFPSPASSAPGVEPAVVLTEPAELPRRPEPALSQPRWWGPRSVAGSTRSRGLTPERLASILRQADTGDPVAQAELANEIEDKDLHLASELGKRKLAVSKLPWQIVAASDRRTDRRVAEAATAMLRGIPRLSGALFDLQDAVAKGYAGTEIDWDYRPGQLRVRRLLHRPASWFRPDIQDPTLWRVADEHSALGSPMKSGQWIWHEARAKSGASPAGAALIRPITWAFLFKTLSLRDLAIFLETYNAPLRIGRYAPGTSEEDRQVLFQALQDLGVDAAAILPDGVQIEFPVANDRSASANNYLGAAKYWDAQVSKAVLGGTLTTEAGDRGTQALGRVHDEVRRDLRDADAEQLAETITRDLIIPWCVWSYGEQPAYPRFEFLLDNPEAQATTAALYERLGKLGVRFPVAHIHATFGIPLPAEGEATYGGAAPATGAQPAARAASTQVGLTERTPHLLALADGLAPMPAEIERAIREAVSHGGYQGWEDVLAQLRVYLGRATEPGQVGALLLTALEQCNLEPMAEHLADELLRGELVGLAQARQGELPVGEWPDVPPRDAVAFWQRKAAVTPARWAELSIDARARAFAASQFTTLQAAGHIQGALSQVMESGGTLAEFEDRYNDTLASHGLGEGEPWLIETVFRTNIQSSYGAGRYRGQVEGKDERPCWMYEAVDDHRTRESHKTMDGRVYPADHEIWQTWYPPNGFACRCWVRALTSAEVAGLGRPVETALPTTRTRRDDGRLGTPEPLTPDLGFTRNPALDPHEFDWARFPAEWRRALRVEE